MKKHMLHLFLFGISKSAVLFAPLIAASILTQENYGLLEWSLSISMMLSIFLSLGAGGVLSFEIIKENKSQLVHISLLYTSSLSTILGILGLFGSMYNEGSHLHYIFSFTGIFIGQFAFSAYLKAMGKGAFASLVESFIYIILLFLLLYAIYQNTDTLSFLSLFSFSALLLGFTLFSRVKGKKELTLTHLHLFIQRGIPIMFSSILAIGFVNLPRVTLGYVESMEEVASFSLYFRWAAIALIAYQFALVMNFRKIYTLPYPQLERYIILISSIVLIIGGLTILGLDQIIINHISLPIAIPEQNMNIAYLMAGIIALWTLQTSLEGVFYREKLTKYQMYASLGGIILFLFNIVFFKNFFDNTILFYTLSWFFSFICIVVLQLHFLKKYLHTFFINILFAVIFLFVVQVLVLFKGYI